MAHSRLTDFNPHREMASKTEFEEKEYENPLNSELLLSNPNLWTPGQVFEEHFGIDAAIKAINLSFWFMHGYSAIPEGVDLSTFNFGYIWRKIRAVKSLPDFNVNLLLQTKRSYHRAGRNNTYATHGIKGEYWFFECREHQQEALERLSRRLKNRALISYASPAFHTSKDLFQHIRSSTLVENSTFVQVSKMANHHRWVYNKPGTMGLGCSEIEDINDSNFNDQINQSQMESFGNSSATSNLMFLESSVIETMFSLENNSISTEFIFRLQGIGSAVELFNLNDYHRAFVTINLFCHLTNVSWYPIGH